MKSSFSVPSCLPVALLLAGAAGAQFSYVPGVLPAQALFTDGVELVDVDADQDIDILFANHGGSGVGAYGANLPAVQHLFLNNGFGTFTAAHAQLNVANFAALMVIAEDIDGDGDPDLIYARDSGAVPSAPPVILINDGTGNFEDETSSRIPAGFNQTGFGIAAGDVDNDGDLDLGVTNGGSFNGTASQARLLINDGDGFFANETSTRLPVDLYNAQDVTLLDVDNDFDIDYLLSGKGAAGKRSRLYLNNGAGVFTISNAFDNLNTSNTYEIDYGDFDGDSDFDAAVQSITGFTEGWARNDGPLTPWVKTPFTGPAEDDNEMAALDYDSDGDLDVLVGSLQNAERIYSNNGAGVFTIVPGAIQAQNDSTLDIGVADLNGDGKLDLVTAQGESGNFTNKAYLNSGLADTLGPVFKLVETPAAINQGSDTVFRMRVQDSVSDDGHVNATATYSYVTTGAGGSSGTGTGLRQGGGQFRADVPTNVGTVTVSLTWTATDSAGNVSVHAPVVVGAPTPWSNLGFALAGTFGDPLLVGTGTLVAGSPTALTLSNAKASKPASLFVSLASTPAGFKGGTLVPVPWILVLSLTTSPSSTLALPFTWPAGLSGADLYFQWAIQDEIAPKGISLSNAVKADVP